MEDFEREKTFQRQQTFKKLHQHMFGIRTAFRLRMQSNLQRFPSTTGRFRKISGLNLKPKNQDFKKLKQNKKFRLCHRKQRQF